MSLTAACCWSFARSAAIALAAVFMTGLYCAALRQSSRSWRGILWISLLIPYFAPELLIGYAYSSYTFSLVHHPVYNEILYGLLLGLKFLPAGVVARYFSPASSLSAEAIHCRRLSLPASMGRLLRWKLLAGLWARGSARGDLIVFAAVFLLAFQEFEMASLMGISAGARESPMSWTVSIFDAQAGGLPVVDSLGLATWPLLCEALVLLPAMMVALSVGTLAPESDRRRRLSMAARVLIGSHLTLAIVLLCAIPAVVVMRGTLEGVLGIARNLTLSRAILAAGIVAMASGLLAATVAGTMISRARRSSRPVWLILIAALCVPGLCGALVVSLLIGAVFTSSTSAGVLETGLPMVVAMVLFLLPRAVLLQLLLHSVGRGAATHEAALLAESPMRAQRASGLRLLWRLRFSGQFWGIVLLCYWAYWELTPAAVLAPPGMLTAPVLLYNFMHYGQSAALSSLLFAAILTPLILLVAALAARPPLLRWFTS